MGSSSFFASGSSLVSASTFLGDLLGVSFLNNVETFLSFGDFFIGDFVSGDFFVGDFFADDFFAGDSSADFGDFLADFDFGVFFSVDLGVFFSDLTEAFGLAEVGVFMISFSFSSLFSFLNGGGLSDLKCTNYFFYG